MYDRLTPCQKMLLPPLVYLDKHLARGASWSGFPESEAGFWVAGAKYISARLSDLRALEREGCITLEVHADQQHAYAVLTPAAHLAVHERFNLDAKAFVLQAVYVAAGGKAGGLFYKNISRRYAQMEGDQFDRFFQHLQDEKIIESFTNMGGYLGELCTLSVIGVAMVERKVPASEPPAPATSTVNNITFSGPFAGNVQAGGSGLTQNVSGDVNAAQTAIGKHLGQLSEMVRQSDLDPFEKEDALHELERLKHYSHHPDERAKSKLVERLAVVEKTIKVSEGLAKIAAPLILMIRAHCGS